MKNARVRWGFQGLPDNLLFLLSPFFELFNIPKELHNELLSLVVDGEEAGTEQKTQVPSAVGYKVGPGIDDVLFSLVVCVAWDNERK